jgi:hypothetical protein
MTFDQYLRIWKGRLLSVTSDNIHHYIALGDGDRIMIWDYAAAAVATEGNFEIYAVDSDLGSAYDGLVYRDGAGAPTNLFGYETVYIETLDGKLLPVKHDIGGANTSCIQVMTHTDTAFHTNGSAIVVKTLDPGAAPYQYGRMFPVYCNEDADAGVRLVCNNVTMGSSILIPTTLGNTLKIGHDASATSYNRVYFDDDGATVTTRVISTLTGLADVTTNVNREVPTGTDLSDLTGVKVLLLGY